ncbi:MAG: hypothetical protein ACWGNV_00795, partial [Bacteroidales bacterium]
MKKAIIYFPVLLLLIALYNCGCNRAQTVTSIHIYPDSVLADVSRHPIGINLDYFMDDDQYLQPARSTT